MPSPAGWATVLVASSLVAGSGTAVVAPPDGGDGGGRTVGWEKCVGLYTGAMEPPIAQVIDRRSTACCHLTPCTSVLMQHRKNGQLDYLLS